MVDEGGDFLLGFLVGLEMGELLLEEGGVFLFLPFVGEDVGLLVEDISLGDILLLNPLTTAVTLGDFLA